MIYFMILLHYSWLISSIKSILHESILNFLSSFLLNTLHASKYALIECITWVKQCFKQCFSLSYLLSYHRISTDLSIKRSTELSIELSTNLSIELFIELSTDLSIESSIDFSTHHSRINFVLYWASNMTLSYILRDFILNILHDFLSH